MSAPRGCKNNFCYLCYVTQANVTLDAFIGPVKHWPCFKMTFKCTEGMFYFIEMLVLFQYLGCSKAAVIGTDSQDPIIFSDCAILSSLSWYLLSPAGLRKKCCVFLLIKDGLASSVWAVSSQLLAVVFIFFALSAEYVAMIVLPSCSNVVCFTHTSVPS